MSEAGESGKQWQTRLGKGERLSVHDLMKQGDTLAKYLGASVHTHLGDMGALQAEDCDREIILCAAMLVNAMLAERQNVFVKDTNPRWACDSKAAEQWLKERITTHFRCDSAFEASLPKFWDFRKKEFTASLDAFETTLNRDIQQFKKNVAVYLDAQLGSGVSGVGA